MDCVTHRMGWTRGLWLGVAMLLLSPHGSRAELTEEQQKAYRRLRRDYFLAIALPADKGKLRKEHHRYVKRVSAFIEQVGTASDGHKAAALFYRGRLMLHLRQSEKARADMDGCLTLLQDADDESERPAGLPNETTIRVFRGLTFAGDGTGAVLTELEGISEDLPKPQFHEVGDVLARWADKLERQQQSAEAIRVYQLIKRFDLWEEESDNPQRKIDLLKLASGGAAVRQADEE